MCKTLTGGDWRVVLRGDLQNYIHAVFANVGTLQDNCHTILTISTLCFFRSGLQAAESIHHSSESPGVHSQRFLEDDLRQEVWSDCHAL